MLSGCTSSLSTILKNRNSQTRTSSCCFPSRRISQVSAILRASRDTCIFLGHAEFGVMIGSVAIELSPSLFVLWYSARAPSSLDGWRRLAADSRAGVNRDMSFLPSFLPLPFSSRKFIAQTRTSHTLTHTRTSSLDLGCVYGSMDGRLADCRQTDRDKPSSRKSIAQTRTLHIHVHTYNGTLPSEFRMIIWMSDLVSEQSVPYVTCHRGTVLL